MIFGNRIFRIIILTLGTFLLAINIIIWANDVVPLDNFIYSPIFNFEQFHQAGFEYKGFRWFFDRISTFPGLQYTNLIIHKWANITSNFSITDNVVVDTLLAIFRLLSTPLMFLNTVLVDFMNFLLWIWQFFIS